MNSEQESLVNLTSSVLQFTVRHPYAATAIFSAAVGSGITYAVLTSKAFPTIKDGVFTPKVYEIALAQADLRHMLTDPAAEVRMETPEITVVVTSEKREELKALPDIVIEEGES